MANCDGINEVINETTRQKKMQKFRTHVIYIFLNYDYLVFLASFFILLIYRQKNNGDTTDTENIRLLRVSHLFVT